MSHFINEIFEDIAKIVGLTDLTSLAPCEECGFPCSPEGECAACNEVQKTCLSCGAKQDIDGNLPCGH
jgi:hypothetical protein